MELLDKYLQAVKPGLPRAERDDILAELSGDIRAQLDDKRAELGRDLTEEEEAAILTGFGHPMIVAGRYQQQTGNFTFGRVLVGPELFPFYMRGVKWAVGLAAAAVVLIGIVMAVANGALPPAIEQALLFQVFLQFAIQTCIWVGVQNHYTKHPEAWNIRSQSAAKNLPDGSGNSGRFNALVNIVVSLAIAPWYLSILANPNAVSAPFRLAPVWHTYWLFVAALVVASVVQQAIALLRPAWVRARLVVRLGTSAAGLVLMGFVLRAGHWVDITQVEGMTTAQRDRLDHVVNQAGAWSILAPITLLVAGQLVWAAYKLVRLPARDGGAA